MFFAPIPYPINIKYRDHAKIKYKNLSPAIQNFSTRAYVTRVRRVGNAWKG